MMIATHHDGQARPLTPLTLDDCASVGKRVGRDTPSSSGFSAGGIRRSPRGRFARS